VGRAKEIIVKVIPAKIANEFIKKYHYSGKYVQCGLLHFGAFLDNRLHGVMSFGSPLDKRKMLGLVEGTLWNEMLELNRMAFDETLPRNSESRCLSIAFRLIKKNTPQIKWILSFADGTQCGDGTIYRASGFVLTAIKKNDQLLKLQDGTITHKHTLNQVNFKGLGSEKVFNASRLLQVTNGSYSPSKYLKSLGIGFEKLAGFQLRYIKLLQPNLKITVPTVPFSKIKEMGASMYKGLRTTSETIDTVNYPVNKGGETPTVVLQTA